jgi:hypothetical protein
MTRKVSIGPGFVFNWKTGKNDPLDLSTVTEPRTMTLLQDTVEILKAKGKSPSEVRWVGIRDHDYLADIRPSPTALPFGSWEDFSRFADFEYDSGFGGAEVNTGLVIVGDDWWLERGEYDGSEWWEFKTLPRPPAERLPLRNTDLRERP